MWLTIMLEFYNCIFNYIALNFRYCFEFKEVYNCNLTHQQNQQHKKVRLYSQAFSFQIFELDRLLRL